MFLINDSIQVRHKKIRSFLADEPTIAVLLAVTDFEWTVRRAILALGRSNTSALNYRFKTENTAGPDRLKEIWKDEVKPRFGEDLTAVVPRWQTLKEKAIILRNKLIHGLQGTTGKSYAQRMVEVILSASTAVTEYAEAKGERIYGRKIIRLKNRK